MYLNRFLLIHAGLHAGGAAKCPKPPAMLGTTKSLARTMEDQEMKGSDTQPSSIAAIVISGVAGAKLWRVQRRRQANMGWVRRLSPNLNLNGVTPG